MNDLTAALSWRYATKKFAPNKKIPVAALEQIIEAGRLAPSSYGLQPYHLVVIEDAALREKLKAASWNQSQITDSSHIVVIQSRKTVDAEYISSYIDLVSKTRGVPTDKLADYKNMMVGTIGQNPQAADWAKRQSYIVMGFMLLAAAELKIDSCPMEGIDGGKYDEILGTAQGPFQSVAVVALGYRSPEDTNQNYKQVRLPKETFVTFR